MKLNKKQEAEILKAYNAYWESYLKSDMETFASFLDNNCKIIGSNESDVFDNKKSAIAFYSAPSNLVNGKAELRNRKIQLLPIDEDVMVREFCDFYFLENEEWKFYSPGRISILLHKKEDGWKIVYQHGSLPHINAGAEKQATIAKVKLENKALREALKLNDLELQNKNKELRIEASLERVRTRTMSMQNSEELADLVATVFTELNRLDFALTSCIIWINHTESLTAEMWVSSTDMNKPPEPYFIKPFRHPYFKSVINAWIEKNKTWVYEMLQEEKEIFQDQFFKEIGNIPALMKNALEAPRRVVYSASFYNFGALEIIGTEKITDEKFEILHRLGKVFDMSYTRFNDLKQAEAQAREALIEAALERVRSRTLAMQKSDELAETAAVLFRQLINLGIEPKRLYIGIVKDMEGHVEFLVTDEDGTKVTTQFIGDASRNAGMKKMYDAWKEEKKSITIGMQGKELEDYLHYLADVLKVPFKDGLSQKKRIQSIAIFGKGFIGMASPDEQPAETITLLERFAAVFNLTYTRFNDLKVAEAHAVQAKEDLIKLQTEKKRAEDALIDLRAAQNQLVQAEKMASLGQLTAGIAHEIQNPLNFVNNFSEVSNELMEEMKEELSRGNYEDVHAIADDVKQNLAKINYHGKRADAIVKGMLQHSRSSSGKKEPADINVLVEEYISLSFHGLRAKDPSFNVIIKTDFDPAIEKVKIISQDIGRVILNMLTNAFFAVSEKRKLKEVSYIPTVSISTKKIDNHISININDNGNGIPQNIIDKIFQPFFTTKPTGQGTGLGLSLSYDIIKAHGGEVKVETKEGNGTTFIIQLPSA